MEGHHVEVQQPEVLKYLNGEISFEMWLEMQQDDQQLGYHYQSACGGYYSDLTDHESSSVFSSWGSAFTGGREKYAEEMPTDTNTEGSEGEDASDIDATLNSSSDVTHWDLVLPSREDIPEQISKDSQLQGIELMPIVEMLHSLVLTSKIHKNVRFRKRRRMSKDEPVDIVSDFQRFQFRKRRRKGGSGPRLPELLRLQMGQANLLVAKGDFKQAANICMEIVREAPSCGLPFKTLAFIYEEQGDKEMSLQYSLVSAFLGCKDAQEWRDLAKRCLDAGNVRQALACYNRGCRFAGSDISLHWERANLYFGELEYRKVLDIYQEILKLLLPSDEAKYMELAKKIANLLLKYGQTEKAIELLDIAFSTCRNIKDPEGVDVLAEMLIGAKKYKEAVKVITTYCDVGLPDDLFKTTDGSQKTQTDMRNLNKFLGQTLINDFQDVASMSTEIANAEINKTTGEAIPSDDDKSDSGLSKYTTLRPAESTTATTQNSYSVPQDLPLYLRVKLSCSLIRCCQYPAIKQIMEPMFSKDLVEVGHHMLSIGEAFFEVGKYEEALEYLKPLLDLDQYNNCSKVWLTLAEIYENMEEKENCIDAYYQVLSLSPLQASVRLKLAGFLRHAEREDEAIKVLQEYEDRHKDEEGDEVKNLSDDYIIKVEEYEEWYHKCVSMYADNNLQDFIYHSYILMHNYLMSSYTYSKKQTVGKALVWELLLKTLRTCMKFKEYNKAIRLVEQALLFKAYSETRKYRLELDYLQTTIYFVSGHYSKAFDCFRNILAHETEEQINGNAIWNLFTQIVNKMLDKRHHRFTLRLLFKRPKLIPLIIQNGNNSHLSGTYKYAIGEFSRAFREWPRYPLNSLLLGVSYLHLSCQKFHKTRHTSILHGLIFIFQYYNLRGENQEACYNVGRAFHQIGLVHFAVHYYKKSLEFPLHYEKEGNEVKGEYHPFVDLHREAAFNLSLIYKASGNYDLARKMLHSYCWV